MNQRRFDRFSFRAEALIVYKDVSFTGEVSDLSLKGLFVRTTQDVPVDEQVRVSINFRGSDERFSFTIPATVVRKSDEGIGLSFKRIDMDSAILEVLTDGSCASQEGAEPATGGGAEEIDQRQGLRR